jgi:hypothetical protein
MKFDPRILELFNSARRFVEGCAFGFGERKRKVQGRRACRAIAHFFLLRGFSAPVFSGASLNLDNHPSCDIFDEENFPQCLDRFKEGRYFILSNCFTSIVGFNICKFKNGRIQNPLLLPRVSMAELSVRMGNLVGNTFSAA